MEKMVKVLLAEDERITALDLKMGLERLGYNVVKVVDKGVDLISEAFTSEPDVIVSDINLKDEINGIEAINRIYEKIKIPLVIISSFDDEITRKALKSLEPCAFISKPCSAVEINNVINNCLE